jgi:hypothetical protein
VTAEIAILNSKAVALAADSAVTINYGEKVYHSVDKLFELSHHHPVGIMFYGRDNFLGIPWETIIKMYREQLQNKSFHTIEQYGENFFLFLQDAKFDVTKDEKREMLFILEALHIELAVIYKQFSEIKQETISEGNELLPHDAKIKQFNTQIERYLINRIENLPNNYVANFSDEDYYFLLETYSAYIEKIIQENFSKDMFKESWFKTIKAIVCLTLLKKFNKYKSGIVFAGFGEKEWLPSVVAYEVEGKINGKIKYRLIKEKTRSINEQVNASIIPFAQVDMVDAFITGIDNKLETFYLSEIERFITNVSREAIKFLTNQFKEKEKLERIENKLFNELAKMYRIFNETITSFKEKQYIDPIIYSVQVLPKKELAEMAETLVNLTSFKRKVSSTVESVGGPIDVAVITKGDGFVWIKKKR